MSGQLLAVLRTGLVTAVGLTAPATCAAVRAKVRNPQETRFKDRRGEWITGYAVPLDHGWAGHTRLAKMASMAIAECLGDTPREEWPSIPMWLCVAEESRPGRDERLNDQLYLDIVKEIGVGFSPESAIIPYGRVSIGSALFHARKLIFENYKSRALIVAVDSLLNWPTLSVYEQRDRVLTSDNSNGFIPGEAAGAVLVGRPTGGVELLCTGMGFGVESATVESDEPQRAEGLVMAIKGALADSGCALHDLDFRITDLSGEHYYFKEAALAVGRVLRQRKEAFDTWHAAECTGEVGAAAGPIALAIAETSCRKAYAPGPGILFHASNDSGERVAAVLAYGAR